VLLLSPCTPFLFVTILGLFLNNHLYKLYNKEEKMNKKITAVLVVLLLAVGGFLVYRSLTPQGEEGSKEVTINIIVESENIDYSETFRSDELFLEGLLIEHNDELQVVTEETQYGPMLMGLKGYTADMSKEFFSIKINGEDAMVGIKEIPVNDKDEYTFEVTGF